MTQPHPTAIPTLIRGVLYPSQVAASRALNVSQGMISHALDQGRLDQVGLQPRRARKANPIYMNGRQWPSYRAAAQGLNVTLPAIYRAKAQGRTYVRPGKVGMLA